VISELESEIEKPHNAAFFIKNLLFIDFPSCAVSASIRCNLQSYMREEKEEKTPRKWLKRLGWLGFFFFLVKGLVWLAVFFFAGNEIFKSCN
jgi:hypothetical protein